MTVVNQIHQIASETAPYLLRLISKEDLLAHGLVDAELNEEVTGVCLMAFQYNLTAPKAPKGFMTLSPYYYFSNQYHRQLSRAFKNMIVEGSPIRILKNLPLKPLVALSGIGVYGKNAITHNDVFGSAYFLYGVALLEKVDWDPIQPKDSDCGDCDQCIRACPTGALSTPFQLEREKCLRHHMLSGEPVPEEYALLMGNRLLGCDICQLVCPKNQIDNPTALMPDYPPSVFLIDPYLKPQPDGYQHLMGPLGEWIGKNYARTQRVLAQCRIIDHNRYRSSI